MAWSKPWRGTPNPPAELSVALADLDRLAGRRPERTAACRQLAGLLSACYAVPVVEPVPIVDRDAVAALWGDGIPCLRRLDAKLDPRTVRRRFLSICEASSLFNPGAEALRAAIQGGAIDLGSWWARVRDDAVGEVVEDAGRLGVDPGLATAVLRLALLPPLSRWGAALVPVLVEGAWDRPTCPCCGSPPNLAESRGLEQRRFLRCGVCGAGWPFPRLRCPTCATDDARQLHYRYVDGEGERFRLACCTACGGQIKVVATLAAISPAGLLATELEMIHLDWIEANQPVPRVDDERRT